VRKFGQRISYDRVGRSLYFRKPESGFPSLQVSARLDTMKIDIRNCLNGARLSDSKPFDVGSCVACTTVVRKGRSKDLSVDGRCGPLGHETLIKSGSTR
jgi:hypothetical protein